MKRTMALVVIFFIFLAISVHASSTLDTDAEMKALQVEVSCKERGNIIGIRMKSTSDSSYRFRAVNIGSYGVESTVGMKTAEIDFWEVSLADAFYIYNMDGGLVGWVRPCAVK